MPADPRRPYVVVSNHESFVDILLISHLPWEMKWLSKAEMFRIPVLGWLMQARGRHPDPARLRPQRGRGHRAVPRRARQPGLGDDLPRRHPLDDRRAAAVQGRRVPPGDRRRRADPAARRARHLDRAPQARLALRPLDARWCACSSRSRPTGLTPADVPALKERVRQLIIDTRAELAAGRLDPEPQ